MPSLRQQVLCRHARHVPVATLPHFPSLPPSAWMKQRQWVLALSGSPGYGTSVPVSFSDLHGPRILEFRLPPVLALWSLGVVPMGPLAGLVRPSAPDRNSAVASRMAAVKLGFPLLFIPLLRHGLVDTGLRGGGTTRPSSPTWVWPAGRQPRPHCLPDWIGLPPGRRISSPHPIVCGGFGGGSGGSGQPWTVQLMCLPQKPR
jgi:hypothetical protein